MLKYDYELRFKIVRENEEGFGTRYLSKKHGLSKSTVENWIRQYEMYGEEGLKKSMSKTKYTGEFKLAVLKYRQNYQLSYKNTVEKFNIKNPSTIANWQRTYLEKGFGGLCGTVGKPKKNGDSDMPKENNKEWNHTKHIKV